jgi:hypothetical protein
VTLVIVVANTFLVTASIAIRVCGICCIVYLVTDIVVFGDVMILLLLCCGIDMTLSILFVGEHYYNCCYLL